MAYDIQAEVLKVKGLSTGEKFVLLMLAFRSDKNSYCFPSQQKIADDCELTRPRVSEILRKLEELGHITKVVMNARSTRGWYRLSYLVHPRTTSSSALREHTVFSQGTLTVSESSYKGIREESAASPAFTKNNHERINRAKRWIMKMRAVTRTNEVLSAN